MAELYENLRYQNLGKNDKKANIKLVHVCLE